ncbi:MAG: trypsin-like peptidase domain-containing protein [Candidatus Rokubacteria bacterium]|nr:trypsin-like peptidase domain-containing protein [Candidatus Rokubacteria bacterium]
MRPLAWCYRMLPPLLLLTLVPAPHAVAAQTARELARSVFPSVVSLVMSSGLQSSRSGGYLIVREPRSLGSGFFVREPRSLGSGFFVREDVVATNAHVIQGAVSGYVKFIGQETKHEIVGVVGIDIQHDLALVKISHMKARPLPLGDPAQVAVGEQIYAVGTPQGLEGTFSPGLVSGIRTAETGTLYQISAPISPGSSGGPVLTQDGKVIGVAMGALSAGQNLNFAVPVTYLFSLLAQPPRLISLDKVPSERPASPPSPSQPAAAEAAPQGPAIETVFTPRDRAAEARAEFERQFQAVVKQARLLAGLLDPGTSREQWRPPFQDFERRYHHFRARYQVHLAATAREREILTKLLKASDLLLAAEETWAKEIAATTELENSRRAREAAQAHHARRQSAVTQVELDIAEENLSRARRSQEHAATERKKQWAVAAPALKAVEPLTPSNEPAAPSR